MTSSTVQWMYSMITSKLCWNILNESASSINLISYQYIITVRRIWANIKSEKSYVTAGKRYCLVG